MNSPTSRFSHLVWPMLAAVLFLLSAAFLVENGWLNPDEGFYANASRLVFRGEVPYRDFGYTQPPLFPYLQGLGLCWGGFTVGAGRWLNVLWTGCALVLVWRRLRMRECPAEWSAGPVLLFVTAVPLVYFCTIAKTYALTQLFLVLAGLGLWCKNPRHGLIQTAVFGTLAVGCRLPVLPAVSILYLAAVVRGWRGGVGLLYLVLPPLGLGAAVFLPFFLSAPENFYFWTWELHHLRTLPRKGLFEIAWKTVLLAPGACALVVAALLSGRGTRVLASECFPYVCCLAAALVGILVNIVGATMYAEYSVPFFALLLLGAGGVLTRFNFPRAVVSVAFVVGCAANYFAFARSPSGTYVMPGFGKGIRDAGAFLGAHTREDELVIAPLLNVVLEARREAHPRLAMGLFTVTGELSPAVAERLRMMNVTELISIIERGDAAALVLYNGDNVNFEYSVPGMQAFDASTAARLDTAIWRGRYRLAYENAIYTVLLRERVAAPPR